MELYSSSQVYFVSETALKNSLIFLKERKREILGDWHLPRQTILGKCKWKLKICT